MTKLLVAIALWLPAVAWRTWVLTILWGWFVTTAFGIPVPDFWVLAGLTGILAMFARVHKETDFAFTVTNVFMQPLFALFFGWIIALMAGVA